MWRTVHTKPAQLPSSLKAAMKNLQLSTKMCSLCFLLCAEKENWTQTHPLANQGRETRVGGVDLFVVHNGVLEEKVPSFTKTQAHNNNPATTLVSLPWIVSRWVWAQLSEGDSSSIIVTGLCCCGHVSSFTTQDNNYCCSLSILNSCWLNSVFVCPSWLCACMSMLSCLFHILIGQWGSPS